MDEEGASISDDHAHLESSVLLSLNDSIANLKVEVSRLTSSNPDQIQHISDLLRLLRPSLIHDDDVPKDVFRNVGGFEILTDLLRTLKDSFSENGVLPAFENILHDLVCAVFELISQALQNNVINRRDLGKNTHNDGWNGFGAALVETGILTKLGGQEKAFGLLFWVALQEDNLRGLFRRARLASTKADHTDIHDDYISLMNSIKKIMDSSEFLYVPEIIPTVLKCWTLMQSQPNNDADTTELALLVILTLDHICQARTHNLVAMHSTGILDIILECLLNSEPDTLMSLALNSLCDTLMKAGLSSATQAARAMRSAQHHDDMRNLMQKHTLLDTVPSLDFDMSVGGFAAIEFAELGTIFPPREEGYSLNLWLKIAQFDQKCHTTIFGAFDASQSCFVLVYLDKDTRQLVLQTSVSSTRPSVRFRTLSFEPDVRYHVVLTHHRASQLASLYIDGKLLEHGDCSYPRPPTDRTLPVQAFVGTPYDLAAQLGRNISSLKWSLSSLFVFSEVLNPEIALVYYMLGPAYDGNFQDGLGSFFTYENSSTLTLFEERRHRREAATQTVGEIIRSKKLEGNLVLGVTSSLFFSTDAPRAQLLLKTNQSAAFVKHFLQHSANGFVVNSSIINLRDVLAHARRLGYLTEGMTVSRPRGVLDHYWRLAGGVPLLFGMIASATTVTDMLRNLQTVFESLRRSWRLSEAFEKEDAFAILVWIVRVKLRDDTVQAEHVCLKLIKLEDISDKDMTSLLHLVLQFIGVDTERPESSMLINPLAYRIMVQDCMLWNRPITRCQQMYYQHFITLLETSRSRRFNIRRLSKMRILKRLIENFRQASVPQDVVPVLKEAIVTLLRHTTDSDTLRSIPLYITSALHSQTSNYIPRHDSAYTRGATEPLISGSSLGLIVLEAYTNFLCLGSIESIHKFIKTVTNKWLLHLLDNTDIRVVLCAFRLLARVLFVGGASYASKFEEKTFGFNIIRESLCNWTSAPLVWAHSLGILLGNDTSETEILSQSQLKSFYHALLKDPVEVACPGAWTSIAGLLQTSSKDATDKSTAVQLSTTLAFLDTLLTRSTSFKRFVHSSDSFLRDIFILLFPSDSTRLEHPDMMVLKSASVREHTSASTVKVPDNTLLDQPLVPVENINDDFLRRPHCAQVTQLLVTVYADQILSKTDFRGLGLFLKAPEVEMSIRSKCSSSVVQSLLNSLTMRLSTHPLSYLEPRSLTNVAQLVLQVADGVLEGWLEGVTFGLLHYTATLLLYLQGPDVRNLKIIRLCSPTIESMIDVFRRLAIVQLSRLHEFEDIKSRNDFVTWMSHWKYLFLSRGSTDELPLEPLFYVLCKELVMIDDVTAQESLAQLWSACVRCEATRSMKVFAKPTADPYVLELFAKLTDRAPDMVQFIRGTSRDLEESILKKLQPGCETFMRKHNNAVRNSAQSRCRKREERVHKRRLAELAVQHALTEHESRKTPWKDNIYYSELAKYQRARQDQQDVDAFLQTRYLKIAALLDQLHIFNDVPQVTASALDESEGRERQKLRVRSVETSGIDQYMPKRARSKSAVTTIVPIHRTHGDPRIPNSSKPTDSQDKVAAAGDTEELTQNDGTASIDEFEIIQNLRQPDEDVVDINRRIMRSLQRGERILEVQNVSRIKGLEAVSCLLIIGTNCLYLLDNLFQKLDGEVVNAEHAPKDECDNYLQDIIGHAGERLQAGLALSTSRDVRQWSWSSIINISDRRFLLRDVALEIFFQDGRSYLLTTSGVRERRKLHESLAGRASNTQELSPDAKWRAQQFFPPETRGRSVSSKLFSSGPEHLVTARWLRGELSNFQYLMLVNTMAGRTFTDLTQYPVFPWVLRDYTSDELNLDNPGVYRDLSKPMGAQDPDRELAYAERYRAFAEMEDPNTPPFHYGTHYSSAMIVTSYLIRLEPFVKSYVLLQGGAFDYADRLFESIGKTWLSASRDTVTDVRELTPEFYYLPEFLKNINKYNFGSKEGTGEVVDDVKLPPWAKGDPKIFIARNREALESPYVTANLHSWIDLVFGYKQQGDAAIEATNVFHHLSYYGAKNIEEIEDERERLAAIGIIHNFGNTPRQIFFRAHQQRKPEAISSVYSLLSTLSIKPDLSMQAHNQITQLEFTLKSQRLVCSGPYQTYHPPSLHTYVEWGNVDGSLRFYKADSGKLLDLFEALHTDHITVAAFVDSRIIVTASLDCTVSVWSIDGPPSGPFDLQLKSGLYGHREAVNILVVCGTLSTVLTSSTDGKVILWDLNRLERLRELDNKEQVDCAQINHRTGHFVLCSGKIVKLFTINGELILEQNVCAGVNDKIKSCAFYVTSGDEWTDGEYILTGHTQGVAKIWRVSISHAGKWLLELVKELSYADIPRPGSSRGGLFSSRAVPEQSRSAGKKLADITCVYAIDRKVFTGDEDGCVYEWVSRRREIR